ncbi:hypothetical protein AB0G04_09675 [Actinoplanes sp. NPDC023801]|uniref:hypothetical protein n=1 Tax=Actinoplanes sp. NPDC023801 TaxID=3154595 RepID=UPI0033CAE594
MTAPAREPLVAIDAVPGAASIAAVVDTLLAEVLLAGGLAAAGGTRTSGLPAQTYRRRRHRITHLLTMVCEQDLGLRFAAGVPFLACIPAVREGVPMAGYAMSGAHYPPSQWVGDLFVRWIGAEESPGDQDATAANADRLLQGALWYVVHERPDDAVPAAVRYLVDLAATGQVPDIEAAAIAIAYLIRAAARADTPDGLAALIAGGRIPTTVADWTRPWMTWTGLVPAASPAGRRGVAALIDRAQAAATRTRTAGDADAWLAALAGATCAHRCLWQGAPLTVEKMPLGLQALHSQVEEMVADHNAIMFAFALAGMPQVVAYSRSVARELAANGDRDGRRFATERALIPPHLLTGTALPRHWQQPTWRTVTAALGHGRPGTRRPRDGAPVEVGPRELTDAATSALTRIRGAAAAEQRRISAELIDDYPWFDLAHRIDGEVRALSGDLPGAIDAVVAALVLTPEAADFWQLLAELLNLAGHPRAAGTAMRMAQIVHQAGEQLTAG